MQQLCRDYMGRPVVYTVVPEGLQGDEAIVCENYTGTTRVVVKIRAPFRVLLIRVPHYIGDLKRDTILENYAEADNRICYSDPYIKQSQTLSPQHQILPSSTLSFPRLFSTRGPYVFRFCCFRAGGSKNPTP